MRRDDLCLYLSADDRSELQALVGNRNTPRKLVWRAEIVLATADGHGTFEIMRRANTSKPTVWRWQERYLDEGVSGLKRDKTRPSRVPPLPRETRLKVIAKTVQEIPPNATHWSRSLMAEAVGCSRRKSPRSSGYTSNRQSGRWFCASMKSRRSRRSTGPNLDCRSRRAAPPP